MTRSSRNTPPVVITLDGDNTNLANFCGPLDENLRQIADGWNVQINRRGQRLAITGANAQKAADAVEWFHRRAVHQELSTGDIQLGLVELGAGRDEEPDSEDTEDEQDSGLPELPPVDDRSLTLRIPKTDIRPRPARFSPFQQDRRQR